MMNLLEEAIIYATVLHQGKTRKISKIPYILHPLEVAQIISTMTEDQEVIAAGILHDVVEDTDGTLSQIEERFGARVAALVDSETENKYPGEDSSATWKRRKEETILRLKDSRDIGVKMLWLADKLANIRSLASHFSEQGDAVWEAFHQKDPKMHCWYYRTVAKYVEYDLNRTGAYKEFIKHINFIWPGTFASEKTKYRKYKEISLDGCSQIGRGARGDIYRYDDELIVKVYKKGITYSDVEREIALSRKAFVLGLPTAISFGIVAVGNGYGAMSELIDSRSVSQCIAKAPGEVDYYAKMMADLAHQIHDTVVSEEGFPSATERIRTDVICGFAPVDGEDGLSDRLLQMIDALPPVQTLTHGDFHTGNVLIQEDSPVLIDMDKLATGHPIVDLSSAYMSYVAFGEEDPSVVEEYMGFSYETAKRYFRLFMEFYLDTEDEDRIRIATDKAAVLSYSRMANHISREKVTLTEAEKERLHEYAKQIRLRLERSGIRDLVL